MKIYCNEKFTSNSLRLALQRKLVTQGKCWQNCIDKKHYLPEIGDPLRNGLETFKFQIRRCQQSMFSSDSMGGKRGKNTKYFLS